MTGRTRVCRIAASRIGPEVYITDLGEVLMSRGLALAALAVFTRDFVKSRSPAIPPALDLWSPAPQLPTDASQPSRLESRLLPAVHCAGEARR
jgi:hypothetical protein